jgi:flagellar biosynthesis/type III secretory pathway M-ring protein FliF/YscJ
MFIKRVVYSEKEVLTIGFAIFGVIFLVVAIILMPIGWRMTKKMQDDAMRKQAKFNAEEMKKKY